MNNWINRNKESLIRAAFLVPILSVAAISISHVVSWYDLANPISWAIYLSIAVEIAAMSAIAASSVRVKGFSVWFVFIIVTLIQFIGNIYFSYTEIDVTSKNFKDWSELTLPLFDSFSDTSDMVAQRRLLALLEGGLLPLISLTCLHFFIKYGDKDSEPSNLEEVVDKVEKVKETISEVLDNPSMPEAIQKEEIKDEPASDSQLVSFINQTPVSEKTEEPAVNSFQEEKIDPIQTKDATKRTPTVSNQPRVPIKQVELTPHEIESRSFFSGSNIH